MQFHDEIVHLKNVVMENTRGQGTSKNERLNDKGRNQQSRPNLDKVPSRADNLSGDRKENVSTRGGTADMGASSTRGVSNRPGSGLTEKRSVTGSDYDGQLSE